MNSNANTTRNYSNFVQDEKQPAAMYAFYSIEIFIILAGTLLNLWFLVAILTSQEMRSRLRNKIICNNFVLLLLDSALVIPASLGVGTTTQKLGCTLRSAFANLELIQDFIANWLVVMLLVVFIAQIQDFNPTMRLTPMAATAGTTVLLVFPWVASLIVVPIIINQYYFSLAYAKKGCSYPTQDAVQLFKSVDTAVPIILAILLVITAAALRYRRYTRSHSSGSMRAELISRGPEIDTIFAYVAVVAVSTVCDLLRLIFSIDILTFIEYGDSIWVGMIATAWVLSDARAVLMPLVWLLLPDIRQRLKTWRPWYRPGSGIDLAVSYRREDNQ